MCISKVLPLPVAIQKATLFSSSNRYGSTWLGCYLAIVELLHLPVEIDQQRFRIAKIAVEIDLSEQQRQILKIFWV